MQSNTYTKAVLTVIAVCLLVLVFGKVFTPTVASASSAQDSYSCDGTLKANVWGGAEPTIGGYKISFDCIGY